MVQNPNVLVNNYITKKDVIFTGVPMSKTTITVGGDSHKYLILEVLVKVQDTQNAYGIRLYNTSYDNPDCPLLTDEFGFTSNVNYYNLQHEYANSKHVLYADLSGYKNLSLEIFGSAQTTGNLIVRAYYADNVNFISDFNIKLEESLSINKYLRSNNNQYIILDADIKGVSGAGYLSFNNCTVLGSNGQLLGNELSQAIYFTKDYKGLLFLKVPQKSVIYTSNQTHSGNAVIKYVGTTDNIEKFVKPITKTIGTHKFEFIRPMTDSWGDYWINVVGHYTVYIGKGNDFVTITGNNINNKFSTGNYCGAQAWIVPFDPNKQSIGETNVKLVLQIGSNSDYVQKYICCDITNIADATNMNNWSLCNFWEKPNTSRKIPTKDISAVDSYHRYDTTLPDSWYTQNVVSGGLISYQGGVSLYSLQNTICRTKKLVAVAQYDVTGRRVNLWLTSDGGANWVSQFDFYNPYLTRVENINTSAFTGSTSGMKMWLITRNIPSDTNKEPAHKYTVTEITDFSITTGTSTLVTVANHGMSGNDVNGYPIIAFTGGNGDYAQLCTSAELSEGETDSLGDNVYTAAITDSNTLTLKTYVGSYDTQLSCRHIHSVNECLGGLVFATGERYPNGWIMYVDQHLKDKGQVVDATNAFDIYRLNSSQYGIQRACGIIFSEEGIEPKITFFSDDSTIFGNTRLVVDGRSSSQMPTKTSNGVFVGKLSDIDDLSKFERICDMPEPSISVFKSGDVIVGYSQLGGGVLSLDNGNTYDYLPYPDLGAPMSNNGIYHGNIVISEGWMITK